MSSQKTLKDTLNIIFSVGLVAGLKHSGSPNGLMINPFGLVVHPCQSFSIAGQKKGFDDPRHLWPVWIELIRAYQPDIIFGEQIEAAIKHGWLDVVQNDLEGENYSFGTIILPACGVGAPHLRQRLWFMAYRRSEGVSQFTRRWQQSKGFNQTDEIGGLGNPNRQRGYERLRKFSQTFTANRQKNALRVSVASKIGRLDNPYQKQYRQQIRALFREEAKSSISNRKNHRARWVTWRTGSADCACTPNQLFDDRWRTTGFWRNAVWVYCTDGKARPIEPRALPLANGVSARVVKIRGYGNAIVPQVGAEVIKAGMAWLSHQ